MNVSSGTGLPGLSRTHGRQIVVVVVVVVTWDTSLCRRAVGQIQGAAGVRSDV